MQRINEQKSWFFEKMNSFLDVVLPFQWCQVNLLIKEPLHGR